MTIYIINLFLLFFWWVICSLTPLKKKNKIRIYILISGIQLFLLSGLRNISVGVDTNLYVERFKIISHLNWSELSRYTDILDFEIGFIYLNKLISMFSNNERFLLLFTSFMIIFFVSKYILKNSKIVWLSFLVFVAMGFWGNSMNTMRQIIAICFLLGAIKNIQDKRFWVFLIRVLLASLFHSSAILFLVAYPISKIRISKAYLITYLGVALFCFVFAGNIVSFAISLLGYEQHIRRLGEGSGLGMIVMLILFLLAALYYRKDTLPHFTMVNIYIHILMVGILLNILALEFDLVGRAMLYFTIHNVVLLPNIIYSIKNKYDKFYGGYLLVIGILFFYIFRLLPTDVSSLLPYRFMDI